MAQTARPRTVAKAARMVAAVALAVAGTLAATAGSAQATPFPETWHADNKNHSYCFAGTPRDWTTAKRKVVHWGMKRLGSTTDMVTAQEDDGPGLGACVFDTDIQWWLWNLPAGVRGEAKCMDWNSGSVCNSANINMDFPEIDKRGDDWYDRRKTALHEIGHTVGLGHHSPGTHDCTMVSGEIPSRAVKWRSLHAHDIGHINARY